MEPTKKEKTDDQNSTKTKINHPGALQMDGLFYGKQKTSHLRSLKWMT